ncbi:MAG: hypothetical protein OZSIB_0067 [Candidatus Ozemobacter sibiricus]|uniref:Uncharacterized protein n=1 Tax=Candidatus Ozemobacter sibiricus TaxID=2268124 RepID=A0A367ZNI3_9BACT|nr:MAG: hypothetical protein OZSIB_0067 [Candidatus Ozemobacter sibiricus]
MMLRLSMVFVFVLVMGLSASAMIRTLPFPELVRQAEIIAIVTVTEQTQSPVPGKDYPKVDTTVEVERVLKGALKEKDTLSFTSYGTEEKYLEDSPIFPPKGKKAVLFLVEKDGQKVLLNGIQGLWPLEAGTNKTLGMGFRYSIEKIEEELKKN